MIDDKTKGVISVWIGTTHKTFEEFNKYTEGLEDIDSNCPANIDFNANFIDTDFFVAYGTADNEIVPVEELVREVDTSSKKTDDEIVKIAKEKGIYEGNALYYYINATFHEEVPNKLYNDIVFIGNFYDPYEIPKTKKKPKLK